MFRKRRHRSPFAAYAALLFNAALLVTPFVGARAIATAYGENRQLYESSKKALDATHAAMARRFERLAVDAGGPSREVWAKFVAAEVEKGDLVKARGFIQAAPAMLPAEDAAALRARLEAADSGPNAMVEAAFPYLPTDVQMAYKRLDTPIVSMFVNAAPPETAERIEEGSGDGPADEAIDDEPRKFSVLGDYRDLAMMAARWVREGRIDEFAFTLAGVGLALADDEAREGASLVLSARRAQRLDPKFELYLQRRLFLAAPPQRLKRQMQGEFQSEFGYVENGPVIERVFRSSVDKGALDGLLRDLRVIHEIAQETSPTSTVDILSRVKDGADLRRARLIAQAGGELAPTLAEHDGGAFLDTAKTVVTWSDALRVQLAILALCFGVLLFVSVRVFWRSIMRSRPVRRSAIYALDEVVAR